MLGASAIADRACGPSDLSRFASHPIGAHSLRGEPFKVLSLFAGIGGFDLGLERTGGFKTVAFCEIDPFCQRVLAKHWPGVPIYDDVRTLTAERLRADGIEPNVIAGGFPCQNISNAGAAWGVNTGIEGDRSSLWFQYARLISELRPRYIIVENVAALLARGLDVVLGTLASIGYDAEWHCIPAAHIGAPHRRDRIWIVAHPSGLCSEPWGGLGYLAGPKGASEADRGERQRNGGATGNCCPDVANADSARLEGRSVDREDPDQWPVGQGLRSHPGRWLPEPAVGRVAHGVPARVDRLRSLGNAVVPQIPELIGRAILEAHRDRDAAPRKAEGFEAVGQQPGAAQRQSPESPVNSIPDGPSSLGPVRSPAASRFQGGGASDSSFHDEPIADERQHDHAR